MPVLPPLGRDFIRSETNRLGLEERFFRLLEQWRELIRPTPTLFQGAGDPNVFDFGEAEINRGDFFLRTDGAAGERLYVKFTSTGTTGWEAVG